MFNILSVFDSAINLQQDRYNSSHRTLSENITRKYNKGLAALLLSLTGKEFSKSVNVCERHKSKTGVFFDSQCSSSDTDTRVIVAMLQLHIAILCLVAFISGRTSQYDSDSRVYGVHRTA